MVIDCPSVHQGCIKTPCSCKTTLILTNQFISLLCLAIFNHFYVLANCLVADHSLFTEKFFIVFWLLILQKLKDFFISLRNFDFFRSTERING